MAWLSFCLPASVALWRASGVSQWRADVPAVRDLGLVVVGIGGAVSTPLNQLAQLLPLGPAPYRAALVSAVAVGLAGLLLFRIAQRLLEHDELSPWLATLLAGVSAVMATLSTSWQREATVGGGVCVAAACGLLAMDITMQATRPDARTLVPKNTSRWLWVALTCGATLAESLPAGLAVTAVCAFIALSTGKRPPLGLVPYLGLSALVVFALLASPMFVRPLAPRSWSDVGHALSAVNVHTLDVHATRKAALSAWVNEVGVVALGLAALGLFVGVWRESRRAWMSALVGLVLVDLAYPLGAAPTLSAEPLAALRALAVGALSVAAAIGVSEVVVFLRNLQVPMARTASVLTVVFHITVVAVACEEAAYAADRSERFAAEEWTDEALEQLPRNAAVLVHSAPLTWRLWNAQMLAGQRPDVVVIPAPLLKHGTVTNHLVPSAPAVAQLLRDYALSGQASEYGLSLLADERPLMVELDERWDERTVTHLSVDGTWLLYAPQVLGRSDRKTVVHALSGRIVATVEASGVVDDPTAEVVSRTLKEHTATLSLLGMGEDVRPLIAGVEKLTPDDPFVTSARLRLAHAERERTMSRAIELRDLLRF